jgi:hypothetical protein
MRGGAWRRGLVALVAGALALGPAGPALGAPAPAPSGAPDVVGLPVQEATRVLAEWNKAVLFVYEPSAELTVSAADVVVARVAWRPSGTSVAVPRPAAVLTLGRRVPDLTGLTRAQADAVLSPLEFELRPAPLTGPVTWVVDTQVPAAGTIVEFTPNNLVSVTLVDPAPPEEPGWLGLPRGTAIALGGSFAGLFVVVLVLGSLLVRRSVRRRALARGDDVSRDDDVVAGEHIEVRVLPGRTVGPQLSLRERS